MDNEIFKSYYAIIPANVRYDIDLPPNAKLLYGEITALCNEKGYCWASNEYFAKLYNVEKRTISRWVNALVKKGYIKMELTYKEGSKEVEQRRLYITNNIIINTSGQEKPEGEDLNVLTPQDKNVLDNNTLYNNIYIYWLEKDIVKHKKLTANMEKAIKKVLKDYTEKEIYQAIDNYNTVLKDENYFYSHIFTLEAFLKQSNGLPQFTDEGVHWINYCSKSKSKEKNKPEPRHDAPQGTKFAEMSVEDTFKFLSDLK